MGDRQARGTSGLTRRDVLRFGSSAALAALVPAAAAAAPDRKPGGTPPPTPIQDPYAGAIPLAFPLADGTYRKPLRDNWHDNRDGDFDYPWSHQNGATQRAHDGVDLFPRFAGALPTAFAPLTGRVAAVCVGGVYRENTAIKPPWAYPAGTGADNIYGNYLWLYSTDNQSTGYLVLYCHLQDDQLLRDLLAKVNTANDPVDARTPVGTMGETGNAAGQPQLHVELHYPQDPALGYARQNFTCTRCVPMKGPLTAFNPFPSLSKATVR